MLISKFSCRYRVIVEKIDDDKDGFINLSELKNWIKFTQRRYIDDDVNRQWVQHNPVNNETIHWDVSIETHLFRIGFLLGSHVRYQDFEQLISIRDFLLPLSIHFYCSISSTVLAGFFGIIILLDLYTSC